MRASLFHALRPWSLNLAVNETRSELKPELKRKKGKKKRRWKRQISGNLSCIPPPSLSARSEPPSRVCGSNQSHQPQHARLLRWCKNAFLKSNDAKIKTAALSEPFQSRPPSSPRFRRSSNCGALKPQTLRLAPLSGCGWTDRPESFFFVCFPNFFVVEISGRFFLEEAPLW